eukprot:GFUD01010845.1.p1 GENE.GFUD01010845.1~~GFUD01010845.1.p1  ORF type:complete len:700 (-),score=179.25 GFUD01010845.1:253-2352(-)
MSDPGPGGHKGGPHHHQGHHNTHLTLTQSDHDIIKSFLSTVPAGFPLSPGAALAELTGFSPLSPSLPPTNYHFSLSPARNHDPPSPSRYIPTGNSTERDHQRYTRALHSPKRLHTPPRSSLAGFNSPKRLSSSLNSPQRLISRPHSPDIPRPHSPINLHSLHRESFSSPHQSDHQTTPWSPQRPSDSFSPSNLTKSSSPKSKPSTSHTSTHFLPTYATPTRPHSPDLPLIPINYSPQRSPHKSRISDDHLLDISLRRGPDSFAGRSGEQFKRPRLSYSPNHSPPPRQSLEYSPLLHVGSFSPRRPYINPPNPYSPVNPPAPYSPRRLVSAPYSPLRHPSPPPLPNRLSDHRYYDNPLPTSDYHIPHSPSQLTHPPSPTHHLDMSPNHHAPLYPDQQDLVLEPLDLDTNPYHHSHPTKTPSVNKSKPLTQTVKKKLGIDKKKLKPKSTQAVKSSRDRKAPPYPPPSTTLETNLSEVTARLRGGCECGLKCFSGLESDFVWKHRCNIAELSKGEHDMYLMGIMMASLANPKATSKQKERQRNRNKYIFQGKEVCQEAFLYLENVTIYQLKSIRRHVLEQGVVARVHKNKGKRPHNVLELDHYQLTHRFVEDLLEKERGQGAKKRTCLADLTCKKLHTSYQAYFSDLGMDSKMMAYSTFRNFVHQRFPQLKFTSREAVLHDSINTTANTNSDTVLKIETHDY